MKWKDDGIAAHCEQVWMFEVERLRAIGLKSAGIAFSGCLMPRIVGSVALWATPALTGFVKDFPAAANRHRSAAFDAHTLTTLQSPFLMSVGLVSTY